MNDFIHVPDHLSAWPAVVQCKTRQYSVHFALRHSSYFWFPYISMPSIRWADLIRDRCIHYGTFLLLTFGCTLWYILHFLPSDHSKEDFRHLQLLLMVQGPWIPDVLFITKIMNPATNAVLFPVWCNTVQSILRSMWWLHAVVYVSLGLEPDRICRGPFSMDRNNT